MELRRTDDAAGLPVSQPNTAVMPQTYCLSRNETRRAGMEATHQADGSDGQESRVSVAVKSKTSERSLHLSRLYPMNDVVN